MFLLVSLPCDMGKCKISGKPHPISNGDISTSEIVLIYTALFLASQDAQEVMLVSPLVIQGTDRD